MARHFSAAGADGRAEVDDHDQPYGYAGKVKGGLPYQVYAVVKPLTQGTAGTIYKCLEATSKTIEITGG